MTMLLDPDRLFLSACDFIWMFLDRATAVKV